MQHNTAIRLNVIEQPPGQTGCAVIPKRWVAERAMAWAGRHRLARNADNRTPESSEAFLYLGSIAMLLNRLYPRCSFLITLEEEDFFFRAKRKAKNRCQPMQPRPAGLVSTALPCSAPSRPCMSRSDLGRCGSEFWDCFAPPHERVQCTKRRAAGGEMWYKASFRCRVQPCSTRPIFARTAIMLNLHQPDGSFGIADL